MGEGLPSRNTPPSLTAPPLDELPHAAAARATTAAAAGLVERRSDADDGRVTRVGLTADGEARLGKLAPAHLDELRNLAPVLDQLVAGWAAHDVDPHH